MWPFCYTALCGILAFYAAKQLNRNPYLWAIAGCLLKTNVFLILFIFIPLIKLILQKLVRHKTNKKPHTAPQEEDVICATEIDANAVKKLWYYLDSDNKTQGPISVHLLLKKWKEGIIFASTYVWNETMKEWKTVSEVFPQGGHTNKRSSF